MSTQNFCCSRCPPNRKRLHIAPPWFPFSVIIWRPPLVSVFCHTHAHTHTHTYTHTNTHTYTYTYTYTHTHTQTPMHTHTQTQNQKQCLAVSCATTEKFRHEICDHMLQCFKCDIHVTSECDTLCTVKLLDSPQLLRTCSNVSGGARLQAYLWAASNPRPRLYCLSLL